MITVYTALTKEACKSVALAAKNLLRRLAEIFAKRIYRVQHNLAKYALSGIVDNDGYPGLVGLR